MNNFNQSEKQTSEVSPVSVILTSIAIAADGDLIRDTHRVILILAIAALIFLATVLIMTDAGIDIGPPAISTAGTVIEDTSEENTYYVQVKTGTGTAERLTFETAQSVYVNQEKSKNIRIATRENFGIESNEIYVNPSFDPNNPPSPDAVYDTETPPYMQLVKVEIVDPSQDATISLSAKGGDESTETVHVMSWTVSPDNSDNPYIASFDVENNRLEIYPGGYF